MISRPLPPGFANGDKLQREIWAAGFPDAEVYVAGDELVIVVDEELTDPPNEAVIEQLVQAHDNKPAAEEQQRVDDVRVLRDYLNAPAATLPTPDVVRALIRRSGVRSS